MKTFKEYLHDNLDTIIEYSGEHDDGIERKVEFDEIEDVWSDMSPEEQFTYANEYGEYRAMKEHE